MTIDQDYLDSEAWLLLSTLVLARDKNKCLCCGYPKDLQCHRAFQTDDPWETQPHHCMTLCQPCQEKVNRNPPAFFQATCIRDTINAMGGFQSYRQKQWQQANQQYDVIRFFAYAECRPFRQSGGKKVEFFRRCLAVGKEFNAKAEKPRTEREIIKITAKVVRWVWERMLPDPTP